MVDVSKYLLSPGAALNMDENNGVGWGRQSQDREDTSGDNQRNDEDRKGKYRRTCEQQRLPA